MLSARAGRTPKTAPHRRHPWAAAAAAFICTTAAAQAPETSDWGYYGGDVFGQHYSSLDQINRSNVTQLQVAWTYRTGELGQDFARAQKLTFEATPVLAFGLLYLTTPTSIVIALDPETGRPRWRFDPHIDRHARYGEGSSRGVTLWQDPNATTTAFCTRRVFVPTLDARLLALDAVSGTPCADFGSNGAVDLTQGVRLRDRADYLVTSPPAVYHDVVITGSAIGDNRAVSVERGVIRAYDARTGALRWSFDPLPDSAFHPAAGEWRPEQAALVGAGNAWAVLSVDPARGIVFAPTSSASPDFFGGLRLGSNRFADSLLALDATSGKLLWHQQLVHHDLWDYDLAAQPALVELESNGMPLYAVLQATKTGMLFAFERDTGKPIFPIIERPVPQSTVPGEQAAPTQPFPDSPPLVSHGRLTPNDAWGITFWDRGKCRDLIRRYRNEGIFTPPDLRGTILFPGDAGGVDWGGIAFDARRRRVFAAVNHLPMVITLIPRADLARVSHSEEATHAEFAAQAGAPYGVRREPLLSPWGLPCTAPPWGSLVSVDLRHNRIAWQVPLGSTEGLGPWFAPVRDFGTPNMGGPIVTAGDLVFVGAAMDGYMRAFDVETGRELWKFKLPSGAQATPMTYRAGRGQRQYLVVAAGGHGPLGTALGDTVIAFALPPAKRPTSH
jgi:quinoprotein glucose dehydrogenase